MSRELKLRPDWWQSLAPLTFRLRGFYTLLFCMADRAGVVAWDAERIEREAGGKGFGEVDVNGLGDRVVWLDMPLETGSRLLLTEYLAEQNKTLSKACRGQIPVWKAIADHWPERGGEGGLVEGWRALGILQKLPPIVDEHHGGEHTGEAKPAWRMQIEKHIEEARAVPMPHGLNGSVGESLKRYFAFREQWALDSLSKADAHKRDWQPLHVREVTSMVLGWIERGHMEAAVADAVSRAIAGSFTAPLEPVRRR